jgi:hypothetical protein
MFTALLNWFDKGIEAVETLLNPKASAGSRVGAGLALAGVTGLFFFVVVIILQEIFT